MSDQAIRFCFERLSPLEGAAVRCGNGTQVRFFEFVF